MNIGDVAERSGLPAKTIRYYEEIGLVRPGRGANGYRAFDADDIDRLAFLGRARSLGFTIEECRALMALRENEDRSSADVKQLAEAHLAQIERKIAELETMRDGLAPLVSRCRGDGRADCAILDGLARPAPRRRARHG
ncbi:MerR family DNA-binding protein [Amaricoccus sp.]|uniref:MerR family DNA-binding protein n=1 Tax=Amaricoccus sp. TaxID=1872485 RepID=UPI001B402008|nr:MerR family DNA-binding protein [Amaricoccus sp.]MBP7241748.1 MerR family DNA-binding protein [Amaricoccus sp.]